MKTKILMVVMLLGLSASLMAQSTEVVPKQQGTSDQVKMTKEKMDAFQAQRSARLNELKSRMGAQRGQMNGRMGAAMGLNLTDEQKKAFKESALALRKQIKPLKNELGEAVAHQKTLMDAEKSDLGAINKNIEKIAALKVDMAKAMVKFRLEMRSKLTEEQRAKLEMMRAKMQHGKGMKQGKEKRGMNQGRKMRPGQSPQGMGPRGMGPGMM
jgi:Spy/CpxP family protein refolding chaperone